MVEQESQAADSGDEATGQVAVAEAPNASAEAPEPAAETAETPEFAAASSQPGEDAEEHDDLLGELARAMHTAAGSQYERINAELERRRGEQVEAIAARSSSEVESLKAGSQADTSAIDAWAKAETEKVKIERLRRIDARREQLARQLERQETIKGREVFAVEVAIDTHRTEIDAFFGRMKRESDPAAIARVASTLPPFPPLAEIAEEARLGADAEYGSVDDATEPAPATDDLGPESNVSESRLMAVMDPAASRGSDGEAARPWDEPHAVTVAAGPRVAHEAQRPAGVGAKLLRAIPSIRPMDGRRDQESGEEPDAKR